MRPSSMTALTAVLVACALLAHAAVASANAFKVDDLDFKLVWDELAFVSDVGAVICPAAFLGRFHDEDIVKTAHTLIGEVEFAHVFTEECVGGSATVLQATLPWHATYEGWAGALPNQITEITLLLVGASIQIAMGGTTCLARTTVAEPAQFITFLNGGNTVGIIPPAASIDLGDIGGGTLCDALGFDGQLAEGGSVEDGEGNPLVVTLP